MKIAIYGVTLFFSSIETAKIADFTFIDDVGYNIFKIKPLGVLIEHG